MNISQIIVPLIILNAVIALAGGLVGYMYCSLTNRSTNLRATSLAGFLVSFVLVWVLYSGYTSGATFWLVLEITFPSLLLGTGLSHLLSRRAIARAARENKNDKS